MGNITIVVPVYADWESLSRNIKVLKQITINTNNKVLFINDCGPKARTLEEKINKQIVNWTNASYYSNLTNLGFVKTCNRAVYELDQTKNDILLLNSDVSMTASALNEMVKVIKGDDSIATVTPRSNNATVFSIPYKAATNSFRPEVSYLLHNLVSKIIPEYYIAPTGHGFCMMIRRSVIDAVGLFDEIYGRGYGEENDFCMRVYSLGYKNAIANKAFVFHDGSKSFTPKGRLAQIEKNKAILIGRYPDYEKLVDEYIQSIVLPEQSIIKNAIIDNLPDDVSLKYFFD